MHLQRNILFILVTAGILAFSTFSLAKEETSTLTLKDHHFSPEELMIPAGKKVKLVVVNQDSTPEEFESNPLKREKLIPGNSEAILFVGPLKPGRYEYFGEFNPKTAKGIIIASEWVEKQ